MKTDDEPELWAAVGNIKKVCLGGETEKPGTKHFKGGAKVYLIGAFWGTVGPVTVIGQHRKSRRFILIHMPAKHIENLRMKQIFSPTVRRLMLEHYSDWDELPGEEYAQSILTCHNEGGFASQRSASRSDLGDSEK